jgi:glutamate N-acetyltransferase/amino-acid N-acetyltransferase
MKIEQGGVCAAKGFRAAGVHAGIKASSTKLDLAMIFCEVPCAAAAIYTKNKVKGAPLAVTKAHLRDKTAQAVVVNSGNANTCNANGLQIAEETCALAAAELGIPVSQVLVASTGVIGQPMTIDPFKNSMGELVAKLSVKGNDDAMTAIMTTDTRPKQIAVSCEIGGVTVKIGGMCKGSGMIAPNMATLLCFITTDAAIAPDMLERALADTADRTLNRVYIDGDTSTNDMAVLMASGLAGNPVIESDNAHYRAFCAALYEVMLYLARATAKDGEGATKLIECRCFGARDAQTADAVSKSVVSSSLVKAALFAADANWGRILCAMGYAKADFDPNLVSVELSSDGGSVTVCENGVGVNFSEDEAHRILSFDTVIINVHLHEGDCESMAYGCDLTYDYVKINAEYRS